MWNPGSVTPLVSQRYLGWNSPLLPLRLKLARIHRYRMMTACHWGSMRILQHQVQCSAVLQIYYSIHHSGAILSGAAI